MSGDYQFGIEEEYFLARGDTGESPDLATSDRFHSAAKSLDPAEHELLKGQVEVSTEPGNDFEKAFTTLRGHRQRLAEIAAQHDLVLFAAGSHPLAHAGQQHVSTTDRYKRLGAELKLIAPRAPVCAMHIHVEVPDADNRVQIVNRLLPFLPLLHALSTSSPFWEGRDSGLRGYRLTAFAQWPRSGFPEMFPGKKDYDRFVERLTSAGFIEDASFLWWHIRPSTHYPTIEMRVCDSCTNLEEAVAIAALYRCLVRAVVHRPNLYASLGPVEIGLCRVNLWRAQQYGVKATFADLFQDRVVAAADALEELLNHIKSDAEALGCSQWVARTRDIIKVGSSADRQLKAAASASHLDQNLILRSVIASLAKETAAA